MSTLTNFRYSAGVPIEQQYRDACKASREWRKAALILAAALVVIVGLSLGWRP